MADEFRLDDDGTITIAWSDRTVTLRRPLFGEYEKLRQSLDEARAVPATLDTTTTAESAEARAWPRIGEWWVEVIAALRAEPGVLELSDLPTWLVMGAEWERDERIRTDVLQTPFGRALTHWRSVPLARGGETPPTPTTTE